MLMNVKINEALKERLPKLRLGCIQGDVVVQKSSKELLNAFSVKSKELKEYLTIDTINNIPTIAATRAAYKLLGKQPSRYRPSAEAMIRRIIQGKELYKINNVVDTLNLISLETGFSIGGYDLDLIEGAIELNIGQENESYQTIGRGGFNIHCLPVFYDTKGPFGNPSSDSKRTMVRNKTLRFGMVIFDFNSNILLEEAIERSKSFMIQYMSGDNVQSICID